MNLLLLEESDFVSDARVVISGRRLSHVSDIHQACVGDTLRVGRVNGLMGTGMVQVLDTQQLVLEVSLTDTPPPLLPLTVLLSLPRPKMLKRCLQTMTAMGVKRIVLMNSYRVEKSFWQSPWLAEAKLREQLVLGLEQARDTQLPEIIFEKRFKPFVEDRLPAMLQGKQGLVAHPGDNGRFCPRQLTEEVVLAIGPEGGFIPYEVEKLEACGFERIHLGPRILRVENAIPVLISKLFD
ncbi:16S rRNA (uracil(1498)-N(3))-methyltransferase [Kistimonas asteriae]|uniref:16S rRNA (uracil(1498)-N(3))-methyltransferase n=1 Tax=Kistimonas asteriae TaxID=517724 RepID=UPI001BADEEC0|nr:16S rRNA (uracil(1498)-N(3))-methyltransferase [Kistimonas asteriae]